MIDNYQETMNLVNAMKNCLPIPAYPTKEIVNFLKQKNVKIKIDQRVEIIDVRYFGDEGGITCVLKFPYEMEEVLVVSLTHLRFMPNHPIAKNIRTYQIQRVRNLSQH
ncbi:conserved hypothetical protein [Gammaproteobacteria bacterium]